MRFSPKHKLRIGTAIAVAFCLFLGIHNSRSAEPEVAAEDLPRIPPTAQERALQSFTLREGIRLELVAAEPLVVDPIAMCFDENNRLFVVEMRDYSERRDERLGRIRLLEDTDGDGRMDRSTIFAENLPWPTALIWFDGGLFVGSTPDILYLKDTNGDGKADESRVVLTGFGATVQRLNVQQLLNSFTWTLENRIHVASGGNGGVIRSPAHPERPAVDLRNADLSFDPRTFELRLENGGGQYGMTFDDYGRKFICNNSAHIRQVIFERAFVTANMTYAVPSPLLDIPADGPAGPVFRTSPDEPWRVLRTRWRVSGLVPGPIESGQPSGFFTSATGLTIYRGDALPEAKGDAFVADVGSNLVHRKKLRSNGVPFRAERAADEQKREFLTSRDLWFRPVAFANGPDGALYLADMYREVVEHPWSLPPNIKKHLDLNSGNDRGRIYRIVAENFKQPALPKLAGRSSAELAALLGHPNGWTRDTAARLLFERQDRSVIPMLRASTNSPLGQVHALGVLHGLGALTSDDLRVAIESASADVREVALRFALYARAPAEKTSDESPRVRAQLAWTLAHTGNAETRGVLERMLAGATDDWERHAIRAALSIDPNLRPETSPLRIERVQTKPESREAIVQKLGRSLELRGDTEKGRAIYLERCATCHRFQGQGHSVGPDLESVQSAGKAVTLANIVDPNREVPLRFVTYEITTRDGEDHSGILASESANGLTLVQAGGQQVFIPRADILRARVTDRSLMPEALEAGLDEQALADLLEFIAKE